MIQVTNNRIRGNEPPFDPVIHSYSADKVLENFIMFEIAYGGRITSVDLTRVDCVTRVMGCLDTTTYQGSVEEMALVVEAAVTSLECSMLSKENTYPDTVIDIVRQVTHGVPLLVKLGADMIIGSSLAKKVLIVMVGSEEHVPALMKLRIYDLFAVMMLVRRNGISIKDAVSLAL